MNSPCLNYDLQLQLVEYLNSNFNTVWFKLLRINKNFYPVYLYNLRKQRYILTAKEVKQLKEYMVKLPDNIDKKFISASENRYLNVVKYLLQSGADIHDADDLALQKAARNGHLNVVKYLVQQGADINADYNYTLRYAAENGHLKVVKYLIDYSQKPTRVSYINSSN